MTTFLHLGTLDSTSALHLGAILNSEVINKKHENAEHVALNWLQKGHFDYCMRAEARKSVLLLDLH